ncbi:MAG: HAMP domain-containing sensor histidine kinase, partial [Dehalococcoidia bacterium]
ALAWQGFVRASAPVNAAVASGEVAAAVARGAVDVAGADGARVWRRVHGRTDYVPAAGAGTRSGLKAVALPQTAVQELADGKDALASSLVETGHGRVLLLPLAHGGETRGVVALQGEGLSAGDAHLRRFTHQAAEALARADEHDLQLESRRREEVLRGAARRLGTCTSAEVAAIAADALERALGVHASVTEVGGPQSGAEAARATPLEQRVRVDLGPSLALMVEGQTLGESERHWMDDLRDVARDALARSLHHEQVQADLGVLRAGVEDFPAPLLVQAPDGAPLASSRAFRDLGLAVPSAAGTAQEVTAGVPPREFVVAQARLEDGGRVTLYREVTVERDALRRKTELIATMGHELRTPLTSVLGYSQMMGRHLDVVRDQIGRLDTLLQEFLDTGRLGEGDQAQVALEALDARDLAQHAAERFRGRWEGRELRVDLGAPAPVAGEPVRLGQVLDNLLENAAKYSPPDRPIDLGVRMDAQEGRVLLSVRDEGDGIAPEHLPHLFERTFRVPGSRESGQGLGLSIVRDLVAAHGGEVSAHSEGLGCGSTFTVSLPAAPAGTPAGAPPPALDAPRGDAPGAEAARDAGAAAERR